MSEALESSRGPSPEPAAVIGGGGGGGGDVTLGPPASNIGVGDPPFEHMIIWK